MSRSAVSRWIKSAVLISGLGGVLLFATAFGRPDAPVRAAAPSTAPTQRMTELLKARLDILQRGVDRINDAIRAGRANDSRELGEAELALGDAKLDLASDSAERVAILKQMREVAERYRLRAKAMFDAGGVGSAEVDSATLVMIGVDIRIEQEAALSK